MGFKVGGGQATPSGVRQIRRGKLQKFNGSCKTTDVAPLADTLRYTYRVQGTCDMVPPCIPPGSGCLQILHEIVSLYSYKRLAKRSRRFVNPHRQPLQTPQRPASPSFACDSISLLLPPRCDIGAKVQDTTTAATIITWTANSFKRPNPAATSS